MANDEMLRDMARHRGFRLVKSRRRKPGGDFGRYGVTDAAGKQCFGFGKTGLTATAGEIESYLRSVESTSWQRSLGAAPKAPAAKPKALKTPATAPSSKQPKRAAKKAEAVSRRRPAATTRRPGPDAAPAKRKSAPAKPAEPPAVLKIREAAAGDVAAIDRLLRTLRDAPDAGSGRGRLATLIAAGEPPLVADRGGVIGCVAWHVMPTLQRGKVGRISLILVAERERGQGTGGALLDAAEARLRKAGCRIIEAISDIAIVNAHGFFRSRGYEQASYRFTREAGKR
jgi:N-acetylglutamate synthase-like GNAT family acetyltransferase